MYCCIYRTLHVWTMSSLSFVSLSRRKFILKRWHFGLVFLHVDWISYQSTGTLKHVEAIYYRWWNRFKLQVFMLKHDTDKPKCFDLILLYFIKRTYVLSILSFLLRFLCQELSRNYWKELLCYYRLYFCFRKTWNFNYSSCSSSSFFNLHVNATRKGKMLPNMQLNSKCPYYSKV